MVRKRRTAEAPASVVSQACAAFVPGLPPVQIFRSLGGVRLRAAQRAEVEPARVVSATRAGAMELVRSSEIMRSIVRATSSMDDDEIVRSALSMELLVAGLTSPCAHLTGW